jgi:PleD family two-component response regulator
MPAIVDQRKAESKEPARQILLVDDDMMMLGLLSECLVYAGYDTRLASSAKMAIDMISEVGRKPDLATLVCAWQASALRSKISVWVCLRFSN